MILHFGAYVSLGDGGHTQLIACDHCGQVALDTPRYGWKRWSDTWTGSKGDSPGPGVLRHHCPYAIEINELRRFGLAHGAARGTVVDYEEWDD